MKAITTGFLLALAGWLSIAAYGAYVASDPAETCRYWQNRLATAQVNYAINPSAQGAQVSLRNAARAVESKCSSEALHGGRR